MALVPRMSPFDRPATCEDLVALPDSVIGELIDGELYGSPKPTPELAVAGSALGILISPYRRPHDGGAGWTFLFQPRLDLDADVVRPDWAGWRPGRAPASSSADLSPASAPDWICELISPATVALDRVKKLGVYARARVGHVWLIDPVARTVEVLRLQGCHWVIVASFAGGGMACAEPFDEADFALRDLWVDLPTDR
jgi:Uma2 family endonuclease